ncbi:uncharacterized protein UMAG_10733 [Mycosarcoma maydis]|uniref:Uncharacterized protein n=1 Tax=Mycosarcoma maydis TaxID=5270 RepID=A0A0D1BYF2_MYCMD|nr:uncharacterized protein UMAG_10733 [Ustilago maydis 521]KIS66887.1 hypothetical protein UMAG_10733 [Ustilago maydis 521]|eukprot:XP_011391539.1 hypothetical protein UMAG_10733 [Ustilago maydis 521]
MNTSNQPYYGSNAYPNRSDLILGLRTEGLGLGSIFPSQTNSQQSSGRDAHTPPYQQNTHHRQQQNSAYRTQDSFRDISASQASLEDQLAAMRLQSSLSLGHLDAQSGYQGYQNGHGYNQQQQQQQQYAQSNSYNQQQPYMQMQLQQQFAQQHAAVQQQQMELLRLQALQEQQQQQQQQQQQHLNPNQYSQQQLAAQKRFLLSQLQAGNGDFDAGSSHHAALMNQAQVAAASAQEQRQAAQASIQASLRQRQVQQLYQTMGLESNLSSSVYHDAVLKQAMQQQQQQQQQQQLQLQNILNRHSRKVSSEGPSPSRTPLEQRSWRGSAVPSQDRMPTPPGQRVASPASSIHSRKGVRPSSGTADSILSMRSRTMTPSIVIDDSASEGSRAQSEYDQVEGDQTPETSEEDLEVSTLSGKALSSTPRPHNTTTMAQTQIANSRYGSLGRGVTSASTSAGMTAPMTAPKPISRAIHLSSAPQHRAFKGNNGISDGNQTINNAGLTLPPIQPRRQPKGQPTEFHKVNFQARINSRLRKDAMSKLCASPRAASFGGNGMSFGSRLSSASSSVGLSAAP